jgi:hypothetical protein
MLTTADGFFIFLYGQKAHPILFLFQYFHKWPDPLIGILPGLAHPDQHIITLAKIDVLPEHAFIRCRPIFVERVCGVRIERFAEDRKVPVPLRATENKNMVRSIFLITPDNFL